jgi:hypothetical protein
MPLATTGPVPPGADPRAHARLLAQVRDVVLAGGSPPVAPRPVIAASWQRMRWNALDPGGAPEVPPLGAAELARRRAASGLEPLLPLLRRRLLTAAESAGQLMVVVDAHGRVLWREGGAEVRRRADALGFVEGSAWDEGSVGTNAIGTALAVGTPVQVHAAEHYAETHLPWTCAAAPLHDPRSGRLLGAVDLSGPAHTVHASTLALVEAVARLVELEVHAAQAQRLERLRATAAPLLARLAGPALVVGQDGTVAAAVGFAAPERVELGGCGDGFAGGAVRVPALGRCTVEPLPGGWLLRPQPGAQPEDPQVSLVLDLAGPAPQVLVSGASGRWAHALSPRHAEILLSLLANPGGRTAAQLAEDLFADPGRTVTVRAEVSRLRRTLGPVLDHQPYRLAGHVQGSLRLPPPGRSVLPGSAAPVVAAVRLGR